MREEPVRREAKTQPTSELLLAHALDACIDAERAVPGSAEEIIAGQPGWARPELRRMLNLACSLDAAATNAIMSPEFREHTRTRLLQRIAGDAHYGTRTNGLPTSLPGPRLVAMPSANGYHHLPSHERGLGRPRRWLWRGSAGLLAAVLTAAATLTASASSLPGEPLYSVKQAQEEIGVRLATDHQTRTQLLLNQADTRLEETARLLQLGRTADAAQAAQRYDQTLQLATSGYELTTSVDAATDGSLDTRLGKQEEHLQSLIESAPEPAQADLREALNANERSRALVADPRPVDRPAIRPVRAAVAAPAPTSAPTPPPTVAPTPLPMDEPTPAPLQVALAAPTATPVAERHETAQRIDPVPLIARVADQQDRDDDRARDTSEDRHDNDADNRGSNAGDRRPGPGSGTAATTVPRASAGPGGGQSAQFLGRRGPGDSPVQSQQPLAVLQEANDPQAQKRRGGELVADTDARAPVATHVPNPPAVVTAGRPTVDDASGPRGGGGRGQSGAPQFVPAAAAVAPPETVRPSQGQPTPTPMPTPMPTPARAQQAQQAQPTQTQQAQPTQVQRQSPTQQQAQRADYRSGSSKPETPAPPSSSGSSSGSGGRSTGGNATGGADSGRGH